MLLAVSEERFQLELFHPLSDQELEDGLEGELHPLLPYLFQPPEEVLEGAVYLFTLPSLSV